MKKKIILTGGGTAGHVTPNISLIPKLKKLGYEIGYIGTKDGIEKSLIEKEGIKYYGISSGKLRRYFDLKNFTDPFKVLKGIMEARKIIKKEKPNVVFSKGGFVAVPVVIGAYLNRVPVISHESDMTPGLANKISTPYCNKVCVTFPETLKHIKGDKGVLTGTPIREELFLGDKEKGKKICGFKDNKPIVLLIGGSLGSKVLNNLIRENIEELLKKFNIIHICGKGNIEKTLKNKEGYSQFEYVKEELPHLMKASSIVISRAGANAIFELLALAKPNLLIPLSKKASRGDQILNARSFEKNGYSLVLEEEEITNEIFLKKLNYLYENREKYINNMKKSSFKNGIDNIVELIEKHCIVNN
ncbi:undecaprenyldiphospho-muramoylpentapeptide beta-N-acetylglucosaminyltransferase [Clostridium cochlearium]|uniref:UDP-N-acetylglucosamine--N-acetylmuramyl-(pentapeptide) pyrophosphoryl-undecaprenol N-acetylglucosamine transferase n=1 Tax=Clostridium cochlearium TaxID=1494 RepID=A0ABY0QMP1_CLOCO|nr:undecaprenyldiphospho-muramoylpentapeptide beta-N-acetylglucosaminyltransferase [Clostridium cochlearium]MBV1818874.1 undecaprenyldiphospho-muramoylpentapeptide beta-N-acetylglucosaminyltransferase [Bacteroidales bacterium MSK.15.36]NSJ92241.1 undecaprenyldiphospho-muramoylpentapeptide beta-N-acetylglucosaminyltransferase [Coprococcus sp. MSK.21.13]MBE6064870.1 undecaprenyldiphospho-muramoylpentapeptide beta-N-acetylglucosaminyltransferase [Clostridium cochlearium]MBU5269588.1 undecaprenyldi